MSIEKNAPAGLHKTAASGGPLQTKNRFLGAGSQGDATGGFASMLFALDSTQVQAPADALIPGGEAGSTTAVAVAAQAAGDLQAAMLAIPGAAALATPPAPPLQQQAPEVPVAVSTISLGATSAPSQGLATVAQAAPTPAHSAAPEVHPPAWARALQDSKPGKDGTDAIGQAGQGLAAQNQSISNANANPGASSAEVGHGARELAQNAQSHHNAAAGPPAAGRPARHSSKV
jgi:hypothetical protein